MPLDEQLHLGEADPGPLEGAGLVKPCERLEEPPGVLGLEADTVVPDEIPDTVAHRLRPALDRCDLSRA